MEPARHLPAVLLLMLLAGIAGLCGSSASAASRPACWRTDWRGNVCAPMGRHDMSWRKAGRNRTARKRLKHYRGNETTIPQLSPRLRPQRISRLRFWGPRRCAPSGDDDGACDDERSLAEALIRPPNRSTRAILREHGIPAFRDVPPIVILRSHRRGRD